MLFEEALSTMSILTYSTGNDIWKVLLYFDQLYDAELDIPDDNRTCFYVKARHPIIRAG